MSAPRQLFMRRPDLEHLPALPELPDGYALRLFQPGEEAALAEVLSKSFNDEWTVDKVRRALTETPDVKAVVVATFDDRPVATASARIVPEDYPDSGYLHWVAAHPAHQGKRLGYLVTLKVLHLFREMGCVDSVLETDDFRLPAIKTYLALGYVPENRDPTHAERWAKVMPSLQP